MPQREPIKGTLHFHTETGTEGGLWAFMENGKVGYAALNILKNGDRLSIYSKNKTAVPVWRGGIELQEYPVFTQNVLGFWIHADQKGMQREIWAMWFFESSLAELIPAP